VSGGTRGGTIGCGRAAGGALWLVHGWGGDRGGEVTQTGAISCGRDPVESPIEDPTRPMGTPGLGGPSGSCLRVVSHGSKVLLVGIFIVGYILAGSLLMCPTVMPLCSPSLMV
jgi:hypothetical protein